METILGLVLIIFFFLYFLRKKIIKKRFAGKVFYLNVQYKLSIEKQDYIFLTSLQDNLKRKFVAWGAVVKLSEFSAHNDNKSQEIRIDIMAISEEAITCLVNYKEERERQVKNNSALLAREIRKVVWQQEIKE